MGLRDKVKRLQRKTDMVGPKPCPECGGRIIYFERHDDGSVTYPLGKPCEECETPVIGVVWDTADGA